jgi:hypothetical protein
MQILTGIAYFPPPFEATPSSELDTLLETIRRRVILPKHLIGDNKKLVSDRERSQTLLQEDIRIKIGDHEERLEPHNFGTEGVSHHDTFKKATNLSSTTNDFSFWPRLLQGYDGAGIKLTEVERERFIRKACDTGNVNLILNLLDAVKHNNFTPPPRMVHKVAHAIRDQALFGDQVQLAEETLTETDPATLKTATKAIQQGESSDDRLTTIPGLGAVRAKALQQGLKRAIRFNLILSKPQILQSLQDRHTRVKRPTNVEADDGSAPTKTTELVENVFSFSVNDPILAAIPLELQSRLEYLLTKDPSALNTAKETITESSLPPPSQLTAADYAARLLDTLEKETISKVRPLSHPVIPQH